MKLLMVIDLLLKRKIDMNTRGVDKKILREYKMEDKNFKNIYQEFLNFG